MSEVKRMLDTVKRSASGELVHAGSLMSLVRATELAITRVGASRYEHGYAAGLLAAVGIVDRNTQGGQFPRLPDPDAVPHATDDVKELSNVPVVARALAVRHWIMEAQAQVRAAKAHVLPGGPLDTIEDELRKLEHDLAAVADPQRLPYPVSRVLNQIAHKCSDAGLGSLSKSPVLEEIQKLAVDLLDAPVVDVPTEELDEAVKEASDLIAPVSLRESLVPEPGAAEEALEKRGEYPLTSVQVRVESRAPWRDWEEKDTIDLVPGVPQENPAGNLRFTLCGAVNMGMESKEFPASCGTCNDTGVLGPELQSCPDCPPKVDPTPLDQFLRRLTPHRYNFNKHGIPASLIQSDSGAYVTFQAMLACLGDLVAGIQRSVVRVETLGPEEEEAPLDVAYLCPGERRYLPTGAYRLTSIIADRSEREPLEPCAPSMVPQSIRKLFPVQEELPEDVVAVGARVKALHGEVWSVLHELRAAPGLRNRIVFDARGRDYLVLELDLPATVTARPDEGCASDMVLARPAEPVEEDSAPRVDVVRAVVRVKEGLGWEDVVDVQGVSDPEQYEVKGHASHNGVPVTLMLNPVTGVARVYSDGVLACVQGKRGQEIRTVFELAGDVLLLEVAVPSTISLKAV